MLNVLNSVPDSLKEYVDRNAGTVWQVYKALRANKRQGTVGVKTRSMVTSTGKKPYKQKKTGSARRGSFVSPLHVGGGVAHGPKMRDYREAISKNMNKTALGVALASRIQAQKVILGSLNVESGKTKDAAKVLSAYREPVGSIVVCFDEISESSVRAYRNLREVKLVNPQNLNVLDLLTSRKLVITEKAFQALVQRINA